MDTPEQPTVWPPPPTVAPPQAEKAKPFKLKLPVPARAAYWFKAVSRLMVGEAVIAEFMSVVHNGPIGWNSPEAWLCQLFVLGGVMVAWKYRPRRKKE